MQAIRQHEFGPPDVLRAEDLPDLHPGPEQVRVAVEASGVHLLDTSIRRGEPGPLPPPQLPMTPGREVAGLVDELGADVDPAWLGTRVVAHLGPASGGYATQAVVPVGALRPVPDGLGTDAAVALIGTGRTAVAVLEHAGLAPDDVVVVTAAAGGLGTLFVQAARHLGATVVGLAGGSDKVARVEALGADVAVDYRQPDWGAPVRQLLTPSSRRSSSTGSAATSAVERSTSSGPAGASCSSGGRRAPSRRSPPPTWPRAASARRGRSARR